MNEVNRSRLATTLALLVGIWVLISPIWISFSSGARISTIITGIVIIIASVVQYSPSTSVPSWVNIVASAWLFISAFVFSVSTSAIWSLIVSAIALFVFAVWDEVEVGHLVHLSQQQHQA